MSLCSQTIRAISRSRGPRPHTLLPFLYQTATIQQRKSATQPNACRNIYSRPRPTEDIPFADADGNLPPSVEEAEPIRKTTITDTERAAFEKLYKTFKAKEHGGKEKGEHDELDQIADEYYEDDEEQAHTPLDKVFEDLLHGKTQSKPGEVNRLRNAAASVASKKDVAASETMEKLSHRKKFLAAKPEKDRLKKLRMEERERIDRLLKYAQTDRELWEILDREVFERLRKLDLDNTNVSPQKAKERAKQPLHDAKVRIKRSPTPPKSPYSTEEARTLFENYPHHLVTTLHALRIHFPRSPLPHSILPTIKALGRSSYALGATTQLYRHLIRTAWVQQSSYALIDKLLTDMDTNIVEFDMGILEVLDSVIREHELARRGNLGKELQMVFGMETWSAGIEKIRKWRGIVAERLGVPEPVAASVGRSVREEGRRKEERSRVGGREQRESRPKGRSQEAGVGKKRWGSDDLPFVEGQLEESGSVANRAERESPLRALAEDAPLERPAEAGTVDEDHRDTPTKVLL